MTERKGKTDAMIMRALVWVGEGKKVLLVAANRQHANQIFDRAVYQMPDPVALDVSPTDLTLRTPVQRGELHVVSAHERDRMMGLRFHEIEADHFVAESHAEHPIPDFGWWGALLR